MDNELSGGDVRELEVWVMSARRWAEATQDIVGSATALATASREVADRFDGRVIEADDSGSEEDAEPMAQSLRRLADAVESEATDMRDRYLATSATLEQYRQVLD